MFTRGLVQTVIRNGLFGNTPHAELLPSMAYLEID